MLTTKSVFVIGAGASAEVGLPIGSKLKNQISDMLHFEFEMGMLKNGTRDAQLYEIIRRAYGNEVNQYLDACSQISRGIVHTSSIDDFIHNHQHDSKIAICGKLAITKAILNAERSSSLYFEKTRADSTIDFARIQNTWYPALYNLITQGLSRDNLDNVFDNLIIICFNYDRCIEHYLVHALMNHWFIDLNYALSLVKKLIIYRPYGSVGSYFGENNTDISFGSAHFPNIDKVTSSLRTYTEKIQDTVELERMHDAINNSGLMVFLGMAFHPNNMNLLMDKRPTPMVATKKVYATRYQMSDSDLPQIRRVINKLCTLAPNNSLQLEYLDVCGSNITCANLFSEYRMSLRA